MVLPFLIKALLDNRARYERLRDELGDERLYAEQPKARGYLRPRDGYRLYEQRDRLVATLREAVKSNAAWISETLHYPGL
jgi:deoxyhypusine synthase